MNSAPQSAAPRRHVWRWVLLGAGICLAPFVLLAGVAFSYLSLDSDLRTLRENVIAATDAHWKTKVQVSVGPMTIGAISQGLRFVDHQDIADARLALRAVKHASVGVYERTSRNSAWSREQLFGETDRAMQRRGWSRLVGVSDRDESVLVYVQDDQQENHPVEFCIAVVSGRELVVVSSRIEPHALGELVARHARDDIKRHVRFAKFD